MNINSNLSLVQSLSALSMIKSANKQPELALQLILQTLAESQSVPQAKSSTAPQASQPPPGIGTHINTTA